MNAATNYDANALCKIILSALPDLWAIYLHGSVSTGTATPNSDLDLALLTAPGMQLGNTLSLRAMLARTVGREVDIADLRRAGNVLRKEVLAHGELLYAADPARVLAWEGAALSEYADHQQRIRALLEDFKRTGIGYGP